MSDIDRQTILNLPSVSSQPKTGQQKTGHWIYFKAVNTGEIIWSKCSKCGNYERGCAQRMKYCPECGSYNGGAGMDELTKVKQRILERIETYIGDIEFAQEQELTEDEKTIFKSVKNIISEEFDRVTPSNTEHIIKTTIKEYLDKECDDVIELLLTLSKDLCERIRKGE
jgi:hypothetical protein